MLTLLAVLLGFLLDLLLADPTWLPHPVVLMGRVISGYEKHLRPRFPASDRGQLLSGLVLAVLLPLGTFLLSWGILRLLGKVHWVLRFLLETFWCFQALAVRGMAKESRNVFEKLRTGTLPEARQAVGRIVGRDTDRLDRAGVIRAAVETVAESFSDGVVAPLLFLMLGGAPLGLCYKAVNTMDSMIGYKNERYLWFGRAAARLDDLWNLIPSRLAAFLLMGAALLTGQRAGESFRVWRRDRYNHPSPNSAQTESVMAGALGLRLAGPMYYFGKRHEKPYIGDGLREPEPEDILRANRMLYAGSLLGLLLFGLARLAFVI